MDNKIKNKRAINFNFKKKLIWIFNAVIIIPEKNHCRIDPTLILPSLENFLFNPTCRKEVYILIYFHENPPSSSLFVQIILLSCQMCIHKSKKFLLLYILLLTIYYVHVYLNEVFYPSYSAFNRKNTITVVYNACNFVWLPRR